MKRATGLLLIALICSLTIARGRAILYTNSGSEFTGELHSITDSEVSIMMKEGLKTFPIDSVRSIDIGTFRPGDDWQKKFDIDDSLLSSCLEKSSLSSGLRTRYPSAGHITLYEESDIIIRKDGTASVIERKIIFITNERGKDMANFRDSYFTGISDITVDFARSVSRTGTITTIADNAIEDGSPFTSLSDYQLMRIKKFAMTGAEVGNVIDYQVTKTYNSIDEFFGFSKSWAFYDTEPILESVLLIKVENGANAAVAEFNMKTKAQKRKEGNFNVTVYRVTDIEPYVPEPLMPNTSLFMPNVQITVPVSAQKLADAYNAKFTEAFDIPESRLTEILKKNTGKEKPSIEEIYNYVSENYKSNWITANDYYPYPKPLSFSITRPQVSSDDMLFILYAFYKVSGYNPEIILLGYGEDTKTKPENFSSQVFKQKTLRLTDKGKTIWCSPNEYLPLKNHIPVNARWILAVKPQGAKFEKLLRLAGNYAYTVPVYNCKLSPDGTLDVEWTSRYNGPIGSDSYRSFKYSKKKEIDTAFQQSVKQIDPMAQLESYILEGYQSLTTDVKVAYNASIPGFAIRAGDDILAFKLPTVYFSASHVGSAERTYPFSREENTYSEKILEIAIPDGYEIAFLPKSLKTSVGYRSYEGDLTAGNGKIVFKEKIDGIHSPLISPDKWLSYKDFVEKLSQFSENWILLRKKG
jgi:hypothetical protein